MAHFISIIFDFKQTFSLLTNKATVLNIRLRVNTFLLGKQDTRYIVVRKKTP